MLQNVVKMAGTKVGGSELTSPKEKFHMLGKKNLTNLQNPNWRRTMSHFLEKGRNQTSEI